jgi:protocatechuate 3,4-dioxygenase alpha subunit
VADALVEIWQADPTGTHRSDFGWGRCATDGDGTFAFRIVKPGAPESGQAPHIEVLVFARGLLKPVLTRLYFPDEAAANEADPCLAGLAEAERSTLVAEAEPGGLRFDSHLQGERETVFFTR